MKRPTQMGEPRDSGMTNSGCVFFLLLIFFFLGVVPVLIVGGIAGMVLSSMHEGQVSVTAVIVTVVGILLAIAPRAIWDLSESNIDWKKLRDWFKWENLKDRFSRKRQKSEFSLKKLVHDLWLMFRF